MPISTKKNMTGVLLAGGKSIRMMGKNKALLPLGSSSNRIIDRTIALFEDMFEEVIVVTKNPLDYYEFDVKIVTDIYPASCPLSGIHSGLFHARFPWIFVASCDLPFLNESLVKIIIDAAQKPWTVVVPQTPMGYEPLCAAYSKDNISRIEANFESGDYKLLNFFKKKKTRVINESTLRKADPELNSFFNINTPENLESAKKTVTRLEVKDGYE